MIGRIQEIVASVEVRPLEILAVYEDFDSTSGEHRYTEAVYSDEEKTFVLAIGSNLFALSQDAAFSWLNKRGFTDVVIDLYCNRAEIEPLTEDYDAAQPA